MIVVALILIVRYQLAQKFIHLFNCFFLQPRQDMAICIEGDANSAVTQPLLDHVGIDAGFSSSEGSWHHKPNIPLPSNAALNNF